MDKRKILFAYFQMGCICLCWSAVSGEAKDGRAVSDSVRREVLDGEVYVIHEVEPRENYYAIGRRYNAPPKAIMGANGHKNLKPGLLVRIPTGRKDGQQSQTPASRAADTINPQSVLTEYRVGEKETLYGIARRFATSVEAIKKMNGLRSDVLKAGSLLKIPNENHGASPAENARLPVVISPQKPTAAPEPQELDFETNRYGIREKTEKGIGIWIENLETDGQSNLALHRSASVGTILKVTNPISKNVTYAKVVGKFAENAETRDAIVVLSKSTAAYIGALDRRFLVEIAYGQSP